MGLKKCIVAAGILLSFAADAQVKQQLGTYGVRSRRIQPDSALRLPTVQVGIKDAYAGFDTAQVYYSKVDSSVKVYTGSQWIGVGSSGAGTVTSVGLSMPSAFTVTNSPVTGAGTLTVTGAGTTAQYIRGDGSLATFGGFWRDDGNSGTTAGTNFLGTTDAVNLQLRTNSAKRFTINTNGAFGLGVGEDYGTSGYVLRTNGSGSAATWVNSAAFLSLTNFGVTTSTYDNVTGVLNIPKDQRTGNYLNLGKTYTTLKPVVFGTSVVFSGDSWAAETFTQGTPWPTQVSSYLGKTKVITAVTGDDLSWWVQRNWVHARSMGSDSIHFADIQWIPLLGQATTGNPFGGFYYSDGLNETKTMNYIYGSFRAFMANYYLDGDWFSVASLLDANFRDAVASDSLGTKSTTGSIGLGAFQFTKPAGKTSIVIGTYGGDANRVNQGTITVTLDGTTIFTKDFDNINIANKANTLAIKAGLNYESIVLQDLPEAAATIVVTAANDSTRFDYVGYLLPKEQAVRPLYINNFGYQAQLTSTWTISNGAVDTANQMLQNAATDFLGYPIFIQNTNNWFTSTQNFLGHLTAAGNDSVTKAYTANLIPVAYKPVNTVASSGYTNLTEFVGQTAWRGFYSDGSGDVQEQAFGTSGHVWTSNGASAAPTWQAASGGGSPAGNYGNVQLNRNGAFATAASDTINYNTANGFTVLNKVGIGTATPGFKLDVIGTGTEEHINIQGSGTGSIKIGTVGGSGEFGAMWAATASPTVSNYAFLGNASFSIFNVPSGGSVRFRVNNADQMIIGSGGAVQLNAYGAGILTTDGSGNVTATTLTGGLASGTYTPTLTNTTNVAASTAYVTGYSRVGNTVTVYGKIDIDATLAASSATELGVELPIASNFTGEEDCGGTGASDAIASLVVRIKADATNDRASFVMKSLSLSNDSYNFTFSYQIK